MPLATLISAGLVLAAQLASPPSGAGAAPSAPGAAGLPPSVTASQITSDDPRTDRRKTAITQIASPQASAPSPSLSLTRQISDSLGPDRAASAANVSTTAEGRRTTLAPVTGHDRCDGPGRAASPDCANIPDANPDRFGRPVEPSLTAEALIIENPLSPRTGAAPAPTLPLSVLGPNVAQALPGGGVTVVTTPPPPPR